MELKLLIGIMILINLVTFVVYFIDKRRSIKHQWRIKESTLILLSFAGGFVGALLAMGILRHKTLHKKFLILIPLSAILWFYAGFYLINNLNILR